MIRSGALLLFGLCACGSPCSSDVRHVARDFGSERYAVVEVRNCGATTGFTTVIRVGRASEPQDDAEEVLVVDSDHGEATDGADGAIWTDVVWTAPGKLSIAHASRARVFKRVTAAKGATIIFKAAEPSQPPVP